MYRNGFGGKFGLAGLLTAVILILAALPADARSEANRSLTLAGRQWLLIERMTNSALLAALGIDVSPSLSSVHWSRDRFDRMQGLLRDGDPHLGMSPTARPEIVESLDQVDFHWVRYDAVFNDIAASPGVSQVQIRRLTESHATTIEAVGRMVDTFEYFVNGGTGHSVLSPTIDGVGQLRARTQQVLRGLLTVAYDEDRVEHRHALAQWTMDFDRMLNGLINGDPELHLLSAPTEDIRVELLTVYGMWNQVQPILESAVDGRAVTRDEIAVVAQSANEMAVPLTMALLMYQSL